jgi:ribosomal protein S18 acetylase RimI-like enzyme
MLAAKRRESLFQRGGYELISIAVLPGYSGLGAGNSLISKIFLDIARRGGGVLRLRTDRHNNDQVRGFYTNNGFEIAGSELIGTREMLLFEREIGPKQ